MYRGLHLHALFFVTALLGCQSSGAPTWNSTGFNAPAWNAPTWNSSPSFAANQPTVPLGNGLIPPPATGSYIPSPISPTSLAGPPPSGGNGFGFNPPPYNPTPGFTPPTIDPTTGFAGNSQPQISPYWNAPRSSNVANNNLNSGFNNIPAGGYPANSPPPYPNYNNGYGQAPNNNPLIAMGDRLRGALTQAPTNWFNNQTNTWLANNGLQPGATQGWSYPQGTNPPPNSFQPASPGFNATAGVPTEAPRVSWNDRGGRPTAMSTRQPNTDTYAPEPPVRIPDAALAGEISPPRRPAATPPPLVATAPRSPATPPLVYPTGNGQPLAPTSVAGNRQADWIEITQLPRRQR